MRARAFSLLVAIIAAVALVSASGAATTRAQKMVRIDVSTRAAVVHYLRAIRVDPKGVVIQRGARNYAGSNCPGRGWSCTSTSHPVVQVAAAGGVNTFSCSTGSCAVVQVAPNAPGTNTAKCTKGPGPGSAQSCTISQSSASANNVAIVFENIGKSPGLTHTASSTASITQSATGTANGNTACVTQNINLDGSTGPKKGPPVAVTLEAHQSVSITQDVLGSGANSAQYGAKPDGNCDLAHPLAQNQTLTSTANSMKAVTQNENAANNGANMTLDIEQNQAVGSFGVASGPNTATFVQTNTLTAVANSTHGPISQTQSSVDNGGLLGTINQDSTGTSTATTTQTETQCEDAAKNGLKHCDANDPDATGAPSSLTQMQFGPVHKGVGTSTQTGNSGDTFDISQTSTQNNDQGVGSNQTNVVQADCSTSGNCTVTQTTNVDGQQSTNTQSGQDVNTTTSCTGSNCTATATPTPTITDNPSDPSNSSSASFSFTDADPTVTFECQIDNSGYSGCTSPWTYDNLADGSHTFSVKAMNGAGLSDPAMFTWTIAGGSANASTVQQLNPTLDPEGGACADGYASVTGFSGIPDEVNDTANLTAFDGQAIQLRFSFSTRDGAFNAYEGWYVKNIQVTGTQSASPVTVFSDAVADGDTSFTASSDFGVAPGWHVTDRRDSTFGGPAWWYGNESTGNYQSPNPIDSCTDSSANAGTITSPVFTLASNSQLSFDTLWQIESVDPSAFDLMDVQVIPVTSGPPIG